MPIGIESFFDGYTFLIWVLSYISSKVLSKIKGKVNELECLYRTTTNILDFSGINGTSDEK